MDDYLQNLKSLRYQMNDIEEEAAKRSAEEQKQKTVIQTIEKDLQQVRLESTRMNEEARAMGKAKAELCCQIVEKQRKISALETESLTLSQTLELLQQEMASIAVKLKEKRSYYAKITEELSLKLHDQKDWFSTYQYKMTADGQPVEERPMKQLRCNKGIHNDVPSKEIALCSSFKFLGDEANGKHNSIVSQLASARTKVEEFMARKSEIVLERNKSKQLMEQLQQRIDSIPPALDAMDVKALEEEWKALLADKHGEMEYLNSLQGQINQLRGISQVVKCQCGEEYKVELML